MPKFFVPHASGGTPHQAKKIFVKDSGGTVREAKKIWVKNASSGTPHLIFNSFSVAFRGSWTKTESASSGLLGTGTFTNTTNITKTGTFDPQAGDILLCMQSQTRANSSVSVSQHPTLNSSGAMDAIDSRLGVTYDTSVDMGGKAGTVTTTHRPVYCVSYKVLTGSDASYSGAQKFGSGGEGNIIMFQLFRPSAAVTDSDVTHVGISNPGTSASALSNQAIAVSSSDAIIQYAVAGNASGSSTAQTLTTAGSTTTSSGTVRTGSSMVSLTGNSAANTAVGVDRGNSNYLHSGQFRITAP